MFRVNDKAQTERVLGRGEGIFSDAWGRQKISTDYSLFKSLFTFEVSNKQWLETVNGIENYPFLNSSSSNGTLLLESGTGITRLSSRRNPRYQPDSGHLYSNACIIDEISADGKMFAVVRTTLDGFVYEQKEEIHDFDTPIDFSKNNIFDIQFQWRSAGDYFFFINLKIAYRFSFLGTLSGVSMINPALPTAYECGSDGIIRFGLFNDDSGCFFQYEHPTAQETQIRSACVSVKSEGGDAIDLSYLSVVGEYLSVSDSPILAIRIAKSFNGLNNTRDNLLSRIKCDVTKKSDLNIYFTRDPSALTINSGDWEGANGGGVEAFKPTSANDSTLDKTKCQLLDTLVCEVGKENVDDNPNSQLIKFFLVAGDILILNGNGTSANMRAIIQLGEEL